MWISAEFVPPSSLKMTSQFDVSYSRFDYSLLPSLKEQVKQSAISNETFAEIRRMGATMIFEYLEKNKLHVTTVIVTPNDYN
mgnify:CR=1 FL=1